jgi:hypothetical protein
VTKLPHRHKLQHVPPHLVSLKVHGDLEADDILAIFGRIEPWIAGQPFWLFEVDITDLGQANPEARRTAAERIGRTPDYALALFGGSLAQRAIATLFLKLSELFSSGRDVSSRFVKDATTARTWLLDEGRRRAAKGSGKSQARPV